jgi:hypothetical protein
MPILQLETCYNLKPLTSNFRVTEVSRDVERLAVERRFSGRAKLGLYGFVGLEIIMLDTDVT